MDKMTDMQIRIAETAVALVETRIRERMAACPYCDQGPNAYREADNAVRAAFRDVYDSFRRIRHDPTRAEKREGDHG